MPRIPRKTTEKLAEASELGKLKAQRKMQNNESMQQKFDRYLPMLIENSDKIIDGIAIIGTTIVIHDVIFKMDQFSKQVGLWMKSPINQAELIAFLTGNMGTGISIEIMKALAPEAFKRQEATEEEKKKAMETTITGELMLWIIAFAIAYFAVRHGDDILNTATSFFGMGGKVASVGAIA